MDPSKSVIHRTQMEDMLHIRVDSEVVVNPAGESVDGDSEVIFLWSSPVTAELENYILAWTVVMWDCQLVVTQGVLKD
jgi:hypothetical protein